MPTKRKKAEEDKKKAEAKLAGAKGVSKAPPKDFEYSMEVIKVGHRLVDNTPKIRVALHHPLAESIEEEAVKEKPRELKPQASALTPPTSRKPYTPESELEQSMYFQSATPSFKPGRKREMNTIKRVSDVSRTDDLPFEKMKLDPASVTTSDQFLGDDWDVIDDSASIPTYTPPSKSKPQKKTAKKTAPKKVTDADLFNTFFQVPYMKDASYKSYLKIVEKEFETVRQKGFDKKSPPDMKNLSWCLGRVKSSAECYLLSEIKSARTGNSIEMATIMEQVRQRLRREVTSLKNSYLTEEYCEGAIHLAHRDIMLKEELRKALIHFDSNHISEYLELYNPDTMDSDFLENYGAGLLTPNQYRQGSSYYDAELLREALQYGQELYSNFKKKNYSVDFRNINNDDVTQMMMTLRRWFESQYSTRFDSYTYKGIMMRAIAMVDGFVRY